MNSLKSLVDVGVGKSVEDWLRKEGRHTLAVRDRDPGMEDFEILKWAVQEERLVITTEKDFGELGFQSKNPHKGILLLRLEDVPSSEKVKIVEFIFNLYGDQLVKNFSVYQNGQLRIRT